LDLRNTVESFETDLDLFTELVIKQIFFSRAMSMRYGTSITWYDGGRIIIWEVCYIISILIITGQVIDVSEYDAFNKELF